MIEQDKRIKDIPIGKKEAILSMYVFDVIFYVKIYKKIYGVCKKLKLIRFSTIVGFESNVQKLVVFSCVCNEPREIEFENKIIYNSIINMKYLAYISQQMCKTCVLKTTKW